VLVSSVVGEGEGGRRAVATLAGVASLLISRHDAFQSRVGPVVKSANLSGRRR